MKLLIAVDMEGISGVVNWEQVKPGHQEYQRMRRIMTADVNAAIEGAALAGVEQMVVSDGHADGYNILIEELDSRASLNSGNSAPFAMIQGIDENVDAVFFIGYHARAGSKFANLDHTWSSARVSNVWLNDRPVGETGFNAAVCGHYSVPVLMVSGDQTLAAEAGEWIPGVETAVVKQATSRYSAECQPLIVTQKIINESAERAIKHFKDGKGPKPLRIETPVVVKVEFINSAIADGASLMPDAKRLDGRQVEVQVKDMIVAYRAFRSLVALGR